MAETDGPTPEQLVERFRLAVKQGKGIRLDHRATIELYRVLDRAVTLQADDLLDREADGAAYILTGDYPSLRKYQRPAADADDD